MDVSVRNLKSQIHKTSPKPKKLKKWERRMEKCGREGLDLKRKRQHKRLLGQPRETAQILRFTLPVNHLAPEIFTKIYLGSHKRWGVAKICFSLENQATS